MGGRRIATGVYADAYGISIRVRGQDTKPRWPLGTPLQDLIKERKRLLDNAGPVLPRHGTLADDVARYLETLPVDVTKGIERTRRRSDAKRLLDHWLEATTVFDGQPAAFAKIPRNAITSVMIRAQLATWRSDGWSESYCDHHRRELGTLYVTLNGKEGVNPVRAVPKFAPKYTDPRGFDLAVMDTIIDAMPARGKPPKGSRKKHGTLPTVSFSKIRIRCMRHAGIPPQTLKRVRPSHLNFSLAKLTTTQRKKGGGVEVRVVPLSADAVDAFRDFNKQGLYGWFSTSAVNQAFKRSAANYRRAWKKDHPLEPCPLPDDLHAYDLRHCFLSDLYRRTKDKKIVGHLGLHAPNSTSTDRYIQAAVDEVARAAVDSITPASTTLPHQREKSGKTSMNGRKSRKRPAA